VLCLSVACKGGDGTSGKGNSAGEGKSGAPSAETPGDEGGGTGGGGDCKPMTGLCQRLPADELGKLFEVPAIVGTGEDHDDGAMGPMNDCNYKSPPAPDGSVPLDVLLRYQCLSQGRTAAADYKSTYDAITSLGQPLESVPGLGDEAYWTYSGSDKGIIQGHLRARKGNVIVQLNYSSYKLGGKQVVPKIAKERAIEALTRTLAKLP
jgi:hypothetical protein